MKDRWARMSDINKFVENVGDIIEARFSGMITGDTPVLLGDLANAKFDLDKELEIEATTTTTHGETIITRLSNCTCGRMGTLAGGGRIHNKDCPEHGKPEPKQDEIKQIAFKCQERFLASGNWMDSVKPLMEMVGYYRQLAKNHEFNLKQKDELIKKLQADLKPINPDVRSWSVLNEIIENSGYRLIKKPDPEIMGEE